MFERLIRFSLQKRLLVILASAVLLVLGTAIALQLSVDVFPDLTAATVTILADAHGMAPEEIETQIVFPIESAMNGALGVRRVRSSISPGMAVIWVEFEWASDIFRARQIVSEKLEAVASQLPPELPAPFLAPVSSLMGEIMLIGVSGENISPTELRTVADHVVRRRLMAVPGVSQIVAIGGSVKQYQVRVRPEYAAAYGLSLSDVREAVRKANENSAGGFYVSGGNEILIRGHGRVQSEQDLRRTVVAVRYGQPVLLEHVAEVEIGAGTRTGTAAVNGREAVILSVQKQPAANTLDLSRRIDRAVAELKSALPPGIVVDTHVFRQADFINIAVRNVRAALRDGALLVVVVLLLFLGSLRTTVVSILAIPLSLVVAVMAMRLGNMTLNTMTLGGMAIAVGVLVDDAIIYVENVFRRWRENHGRPEHQRQDAPHVVYAAAREIQQPMIVATLIIIAVFLPFFFLSGLEGRLLRPLGFSFVISVFASLLVALTIIPALSVYVLPRFKAQHEEHEPWLLRRLKAGYRPLLEWALRRGRWLLAGAVVLCAAAVLLFATRGRSFLPEFNEGSATIIAATPPGTALEESHDIGRMVETLLLEHPQVAAVARRTGRGELDEHSFGSGQSELEVRFRGSRMNREQVFAELRERLSVVPGTFISVGQPLSHRIDHMLSGTQAALAVKVFGSSLYELRALAEEIRTQMSTVEGIVDLAVELQVDIPQLRIRMDRDAMAVHGVMVADLARDIETAFQGETVGHVLEGQIPYDIVLRYPESARASEDAIRHSLFSTPAGYPVPLYELAKVQRTTGPNRISRENGSRKIVVQANIAGRDLGSVVQEVQEKIARNVTLPQGYFVTYGGQFESAQSANRTVTLLSVLAIVAIFVLLYSEFSSFRDALIVMVNLPLALIGGVFAMALTGGVVSVASLVGFVTLFGIAARNGILLIAHYRHLMMNEGLGLRDAIVRGSLERMSPILMTALTAALAMLPLALGSGQPGKEIEAPMAIVILGGLLSSTLLNMLVLPALYLRLGRARLSR